MKTETIIISCALLISFIGLLCIYSNTHLYIQVKDIPSFFRQILNNLDTPYGGQAVRLLISLLIFLFMSNFFYRRLWDWSYFLYAGIMILLILVMISGHMSLGAQRWLKVWWFNFQPSELAKIIIIVVLARYFSKKSMFDLTSSVEAWGPLRSFAIPGLIVFAPVLLIVKQPDLGTGIMVALIFLIMVFYAGIRLKYVIIFLSAALLLSPIIWHLMENYQRQRLLVFMNPNIDPLGAGYTVIQSKIAVGSGWLFGKGWLEGTQSQLHFLPEAHTDFIFATWAEEKGFLGSLFLISLYFLLILQILRVANNSKDNFAKLLCIGIAGLFTFQSSINILMTMGFSPVVGVPLPLMSFGGSSLFSSFISLGIVVNILRQRQIY